jgi:hypothetical protein
MTVATDALPNFFFPNVPDFRNVVRHADITFLQAILKAARYSTDGLKAEAIAAVLGSPTSGDAW